MPAPRRRSSRLLIISSDAGGINPDVEAKLRSEFADPLILPFDPREDFGKLLTPRARVVVAGGYGTVAAVVRKLADSKHPVGILSLGTFNNFAVALGLPADIDKQIEVIRKGRPRRITLGRVNGRGRSSTSSTATSRRRHGPVAGVHQHVLDRSSAAGRRTLLPQSRTSSSRSTPDAPGPTSLLARWPPRCS